MRTKYIVLSILLLIGVSVFAQKKEYKGKIQITPLGLKQTGDSLYIKILYNVSGVNVHSNHSISLFPVLIAPQHEVILPEVMIKGRNNYRTFQRKMALLGKKNYDKYITSASHLVVKGYGVNKSQVLEYNKVIAFEPWMTDARLDIQEDLCGCGNSPRVLSMSQLVNKVQTEKIIEPYQMAPSLAYVCPKVEVVKSKKISKEIFLNFVVNKADIRSDYMNNSAELEEITNLINEVKNNPNIVIRGIDVVGYASPEGTLEGNKLLSKERAMALANYLAPHFAYPKNLYQIVFGGENWIGLKKCIQQSDLPYKTSVLNILNDVSAESGFTNMTSSKNSLMSLNDGEVYKYLLREYYPQLRKTICKMEYEVKGFDVAEAKALIDERPQDLSLNEMFQVADTYEKGSSEFIAIFEIAVRMYPDDPIANLNAASAALDRKDTTSAERYLGKAITLSRTAEYNNARGVLAMLKGNYEEAEEYLRMAADAGLKVAKSNLEEIKRKLEKR